jgi:hypothetical protein
MDNFYIYKLLKTSFPYPFIAPINGAAPYGRCGLKTRLFSALFLAKRQALLLLLSPPAGNKKRRLLIRICV